MSMRRFSTTARSPRVVRALVAAASFALLAPALAACEGESLADEVTPGEETTSPAVPPLKIRTNVAPNGVPVDREVKLTATGGELRSVKVTSAAGPLAGELSKNGTTWVASGRLEPGVAYQIHSVGTRSDGQKVVRDQKFRTEDLTLDEQTYPSVAPLQGETVGVGMPVIVTFDIPVTDRASIERHMSVSSTPRQPGAWHWLSDQEVHWRPKNYWQAGSSVEVDVDINSIPAGAGIYGQESRHVEFDIGDAHIYKVNMDTHQMRVFSNGALLRTIPITTGEEPKFTTRSGVKVILEKFRKKRMNSETVGIDRNSPDGYDIDDVEYAMRVTYSGEFVHAAPWSVSSQGSANVSHGCTGMSTADAGWLYNMTSRGDVVEYTGTDRPMTLTNGYGDWNLDFASWSNGSALS
ncbi:L,D-transpeptidase [Nocardioides sp.]|uniref:L,D-transpeptidase n=1 Tax=Nocardioides sp. TaxID=35761 RepID=UPI002D7F6EEB|nr:Ig-like domain-containing protein [Nocardioides sp.]HET8961990.1 Ig-like domain-containing protein [Nocardioides sp.]